jgi:hypothetical protein
MNKFLTSILLMFGMSSFAQNYATDSISLKSGIPTNWTVYVSNEDFEIKYKASPCDPSRGYDNEMILLRIKNNSNTDLVIDWHMIMYFSETCKTCDYFDEYHYAVAVAANSSVEGSCDLNGDYQLKMFSKFIDASYSIGEQLTAFELRDLNVLTQ